MLILASVKRQFVYWTEVKDLPSTDLDKVISGELISALEVADCKHGREWNIVDAHACSRRRH